MATATPTSSRLGWDRLLSRGRCRACGGFVPAPLNRCRRRRCPGYGPLWAGDQRRKLFANLNVYAEQVPTGVKAPRVLVTAVTAPGVEGGMEWDEHHCRALGPHKHTGGVGCRVRVERSAAWNDDAAARWRDLHRAAYQACLRAGLKPWLLVRVFELQKRGLLHAHPVLAYSTLQEKRAADRYLTELDRLRHHYGFGYVERRTRVREPRAAAAYLSSYFVKGKRGKLSLEESVRSGQMPRSIVHVSHRLTQDSGVTMRALRLRRFAWVLIRDKPLRDRLGMDVWVPIVVFAHNWRGGDRAPPLSG